MDALGIDPAAAGQSAAFALLATSFIFFVLSPIGGYFLHKFIKSKTPNSDTFALVAAAFCMFLITFALTLGVILYFTEQNESTFTSALLISAVVGLIATAITAVVIVRFVERGKQKISRDEQDFSVWDEDKRKKPKNMRKMKRR
jgi:ABC-type Co2+ transport system permease subunit